MTQRMAVVHEWVSARAGSEQVFEALAQLYPHADLFALSRDPGVPIEVGERQIETTLLDIRALRDRRSLTLPLMPCAWRMLGRRDYDIVLTSHHSFATSNVLARAGGVHLAYVHTPARYVWTPELDGRGAGRHLAPVRKALSLVDKKVASRLTGVAANSAEVARRVERFWGREARVIHPPVDTEYFSEPAEATLSLPQEYLLGFGRWIPYKNHLLVIEVGERLDLPVVIAGSGPLESQLRERARVAKVPVHIFKQPTREHVRELLQRASALLFPTQEDFGIVPVEAMAAGTPVVAYARGGATETVSSGVSGVLVGEHAAAVYADAVREAAGLSSAACRHHASTFSAARFREDILAWIGL